MEREYRRVRWGRSFFKNERKEGRNRDEGGADNWASFASVCECFVLIYSVSMWVKVMWAANSFSTIRPPKYVSDVCSEALIHENF